MTDEEVEEYEEKIEIWLQKEAQVREFIYGTIDKSTLLQIKNKLTAVDVWKKLASIHSDKGAMFETELLTQLSNSRFHTMDSTTMHKHLAGLTTLNERLAEIALNTLACQTHTKVSSDELIISLNQEANSNEIENNINKSNLAMLAAHAKAAGNNKLKSKGGKG
ncbi:hypothetical protein C0991_004262, partial [Blastosporella zonata]